MGGFLTAEIELVLLERSFNFVCNSLFIAFNVILLLSRLDFVSFFGGFIYYRSAYGLEALFFIYEGSNRSTALRSLFVVGV